MGEQIATIIWRRNDIYRDNLIIIEKRKLFIKEQATAVI
jgi:hypothetical protein